MQVSEAEMRASSTRVSQSLTAPDHLGARTTSSATRSTAIHSNAAPASSTTPAGDITSNDFLTLLVTEMKNQDPTQPTDPNAYIQQLVGVNSLQQLISINQELGTAAGSTGSTSGSVTAPTGVTPSAASSAVHPH